MRRKLWPEAERKCSEVILDIDGKCVGDRVIRESAQNIRGSHVTLERIRLCGSRGS